MGDLIRGVAPDGRPADFSTMLRMLDGYAVAIGPWAEAAGNFMLADVRRRTERQWRKLSLEIGDQLRTEIATAPTGAVYRALQREQVDLIQSIPLKAAQRVQELTERSLTSGRRAESIAKEIMASGEVAQSRARLIARTEVARSSANFNQARAEALGSEGYIWRTSDDADVRDTHKAMEGKYVRWSSPPKTDPSLDPYHAGCGPNCRCFADPIFPDL